jgi:Spy/CpxP family protein refolding chaperone
MMNRGLIVLLALSLAANVFLGGFVAGRFFGGPHHRVLMHGMHDRGPGMFRDTDVLSEEGQEAFRAVFKEKRDELRPSFRETRRLRDELGAALAADPWDRPRVENAFAALREIEGAHQAAFSQTLIDAFEKLSAADRKALVEAAHKRREDWRERRKRRRGGHDGDGPPDGPPPGDPPLEDEAQPSPE